MDIVTVTEPIEHSDVRGAVAPPSTGQRMEHSGSGRMVSRAIQKIVIPQLTLGPGDRSPHRTLGR